jgi:hypothetical protein
LWDAWERLKTLETGRKKQSIESILAKASKDKAFRDMLNTEAMALTKIGNDFAIRHHETTKVHITEAAHYDFLFHRLFALIALLLRATQRMN